MSAQALLFDAFDTCDAAPMVSPESADQPCAIQARDYQQRGIDRAFELFANGVRGAIFRQPTGTGKTVSGALIAKKWLEHSANSRVLVLAHERQLVHQFAEEIRDILGLMPGIEMASESVNQWPLPLITVASRATLAEREGKGSRIEKFDAHAYRWLLVVDECHRWAYKLRTCRHIVDWFDANTESRRLGLTATPERGDKVSLAKLFPEVASDYRLYDLDGGPCAVNDGWAVRYDQRFVTVEGVDFKNLREVRGDFDDAELESILAERETLLKLVRPTLDLVEDRRTIIFSPTVGMAKKVANCINGEVGSAVAESLDGSVPDAERKDTYRRHKEGRFQFLSVCGLCREGYNDPGIQAVAIYRPTKSRSLAEQMKGRGCRPLRGLVDGLATREDRLAAIAASEKPNCMVVDLVGVSGMADCASTAHILASGLPDEVIARANRNAIKHGDRPTDMEEELRRASRELAEEREAARQRRLEAQRREREEAERQAKLRADVRYTAQEVAQGHGGRSATERFELRAPFGKFKGQPFSKCPRWSLEWMLKKCRSGVYARAIEKELRKRGGNQPMQKSVADGPKMPSEELASRTERSINDLFLQAAYE